MKKILALILALCMVFALCACGETEQTEEPAVEEATEAAETEEATEAAETEETEDLQAAEDTVQATEGAVTDVYEEGAELNTDIKVGVILVGDENEGYTYAHMDGIRVACETLGLDSTNADSVVWCYNIPEDETCYDKAVELAEAGCDVIFANSYSHQTYLQQAAEEYPEVQFVSMTGDTAAASGLENFSNAFTEIYEARFASGVVAGMKIAELVANDEIPETGYDEDGNVKVGYVGAYPYAEVVSGYTAFFLGIRSVVENVVMEVKYTNSWFDLTKEGEAAKAMIADGCVIIGQHADSTGAPSACQEALDEGTVVYSVGYNVDMLAVAPTAALTSATNNWSVYYTYAIAQVMQGEKIATNWRGGYAQNAVGVTELGESCAEGTQEKLDEVQAAMLAGELNVFDTSTFTCPVCTDGSYRVDEDGHVTVACVTDTDGNWAADTNNAVFDGYFHESYQQSAPAFALRIDGITELTEE